MTDLTIPAAVHAADGRAANAAPFQFGTKAETLERLRGHLNSACILDLMYFTVADWSQRRAQLVHAVCSRMAGVRVAVRSSAQSEDRQSSSMAGAFLTRLDVDSTNVSEVAAAVDAVVKAMTGNPRDQVLVQPMLHDVAVAGVILSYDLTHGAPYYVLSFDDETGATDAVTAGRGIYKSLMVYRDAPPAYVQSPRVARFLALIREIEALSEGAPVDVEFALTRAGELVLLQARRIACTDSWHPVTERRVARQLVFLDNHLRDAAAPRAGLLGSRSILGVMPDWNPAELIGLNPRPLAASLYRQLITRSVWREARAFMGYRTLPNAELMLLLNGRPYIDTRASFNSLLPQEVDANTGTQLVDAWLERLEHHPELHDKIEFEIASTCLEFDFQRGFRARYPDLLSSMQLRAYAGALARLTRDNVSLAPQATLARAQRMVDALVELNRQPRPASNASPHRHLLEAVDRLDACKRNGTFAFAVIARHAFIAEALLRSARDRGALDDTRLAQFKRGIRTVTGSMLRQYDAVCRGLLDRSEFLGRFGHLRPGTYDITSRRYDERADLFGEPLSECLEDCEPFALRQAERSGLAKLLSEVGLDHLAPDDLLAYAGQAIAGREEAKFVFTRTLSDVLQLLTRWGELQGLSRDDLSFVSWPAIETSLIEPLTDHADRHFRALADQGRHAVEEASAIKLSHLLRGPRDIYVATLHRSEPNFVGIGSASAALVEIDAHTPTTVDLYRKIVCVENADPGFDWIFTKGPCALVTKFGGVNSHMAIRCAELGLPAAIGCGEQTYLRLRQAGAAEIDCAARMLRPLHGS